MSARNTLFNPGSAAGSNHLGSLLDEHYRRKSGIAYILGKAILFSSFQFAIGSVEMSSKFSVKNFSSNQETLDNAVIALRDYMLIGMFWTLGTCLIFFANYGTLGLGLNLGANLAIIAWIYFSYEKAFQDAAAKYKLQVPSIFQSFK